MRHTFVAGDKVQYVGCSISRNYVSGDYRATVMQVSDRFCNIRFKNGKTAQAAHFNLVLLADYRDEETRVAANHNRGGGMKFDQGKPQARLLFEDCPLALNALMMVMSEAVNVKGYEPHSWMDVPNNIERYTDAKFRHMLKRLSGELVDSDFGLPHRAHEIINDLFLLELELRAKRDGTN